jgi:hypothetical protein
VKAKINNMKIRSNNVKVSVATPLLEECEDDSPLPKWGLGSLLGLPKLPSSIVGVKTPCIEVFSISLERLRSVDVENGFNEPFEHMQHNLWQKKKP